MSEKSTTLKYLDKLFTESGTACIELIGKCQKCGTEVSLTVFHKSYETHGNGGCIKSPDPEMPLQFKCTECLASDNGRISPTLTEVFSRVCGYLRPVKGYNPGKKAEFAMRTNYDVSR